MRARPPSPRRVPITPRDVAPALVAAIAGIGITHAIALHGSVCAGSCTSQATVSTGGEVLLAIAAASLLVRRTLPRAVLALIAALITADAVAGQVGVPMVPALAVAFVTVAVRGDRPATWSALVWAALVGLPLTFGVAHLAESLAWLIVIGLGAEALRMQRGRRAAQQRSREEAALRRAEEERLRIARELHDVLAHSISLISVQSGVALHLLDEHPEQARPALEVINEASGEALRELRSVLGVLRRVDEQAPRRPTAGLQRLPELVGNADAAGVAVRSQTRGTPRSLPAAIDLAAYRIVQESLTNVARHAGGARATVTVGYAPDAVTIEIDDDGPPVAVAVPDAGGSGNGIVGMRERALALGGELDAGPRPDGAGFRVRARLPTAGGGRR